MLARADIELEQTRHMRVTPLDENERGECPLDVFFMDMLAVSPPKFRPMRMMGM